MNEKIKILELFGGIVSPRIALRNIGIDVKAIDYVEIDEKAVRSYNAMFESELAYQTQTVVGYNLKPDILIHGSPCQDFSIAGHQKGANEGSGTRSSLMWETINIIKQMGEWRPKYVIWENVKNVRSKYMVRYHDKYISEMQKLGYVSTFEILDARDFGLPQARQRVFTISVLNGDPFDFADLIKTPMKDINDFLETNVTDEKYIVTQPSMIKKIENKDSKGFKVNVIENFAYTITCKQMRSPNSGVIALPDGRYRYLTERECWRLQGYNDTDFENALKVNKGVKGKLNGTLYKQAGNSIPVTIFESIFKKMLLNEVQENNENQLTIFNYLRKED